MPWNDFVSRAAKLMYGVGFLVALIVALAWTGPVVLVAAWPYWLTAIVAPIVVFGVRDWRHRAGWFARKPTPAPRPERVIQLGDGTVVKVDGEGKRWQPRGTRSPRRVRTSTEKGDAGAVKRGGLLGIAEEIGKRV